MSLNSSSVIRVTTRFAPVAAPTFFLNQIHLFHWPSPLRLLSSGNVIGLRANLFLRKEDAIGYFPSSHPSATACQSPGL